MPLAFMIDIGDPGLGCFQNTTRSLKMQEKSVYLLIYNDLRAIFHHNIH